MDYQSFLGAFSAYDAMANAGARTAVRGMIPPGQDWQSRRSNAGLRASAMGEAAARFQQLPDIPGPAPGWRDQKLDQLLAGGAPGVHHGAFGGRSVQIPGGQYRTHPMAVNSAPMAPMSKPAGDPGLWYNQTPQPFDANAYVDGNSQRINAGQMRAVANMRDDGGVQLLGGGRFMDPISAAKAYVNMGGKGLTYDNAGQPVLNGRTASAEDMHRANLGLRGASANAKMADIRANSRARQAWGAAQEGNMAPLMRAVDQGLIKLPGMDQAPAQKAGVAMMQDILKGMVGQLPPDQVAALAPVIMAAADSGDPSAMTNAMTQVAGAARAHAKMTKSRNLGQHSVDETMMSIVDAASTPDVAYTELVKAGYPERTSRQAIASRHKDWIPPADRHRVMASMDADGDVTSIGDYVGVYADPLVKWFGDLFPFTGSASRPKKPAQQGSMQQMPQVGPVDPNGLQPIPNAPLGPSPPGAMQPMNAPGGWLEQLGWNFLGGNPQLPQMPQSQPGAQAQPRFNPAPAGNQAAPYNPGSLGGRFKLGQPLRNWRKWAATGDF